MWPGRRIEQSLKGRLAGMLGIIARIGIARIG
jgi:hypothetical protein